MSNYEDKSFTLNSLKIGEKAIIVSVKVADERKLIFEKLGFVAGAIVETEKSGKNLILKIKGTVVTINKKEAEKIIVEKIKESGSDDKNDINSPKKCESCTYCNPSEKYNKNNSKFCTKNETVTFNDKKILLVGNPNVGKSKIFSRITGLKVFSSNFPGTTVEIKNAPAEFISVIGEKNYKISTTVFDIPGLYHIGNNINEHLNNHPHKHYTFDNNAEKIAENEIRKTDDYDLLLYVLDAELLERSLNLALSILEIGKPVIFILNKYETAQTKGIHINSQLLSEDLSSPVIELEAMSGSGLHNLEKIIVETFVKINELPEKYDNLKNNKDIFCHHWDKVSKIIKNVQLLEHRHPTFLEKLSTFCVKPITGIPIAFFVLILTFAIIVTFGEFCNGWFDWLQKYLLKSIEKDTNSWIPVLKAFFLGELDIDGTIIEIPGVLTEGLSISFGVFIYYFIFYLIFEILADIGYLPRLAVLTDSMLHKIGIHGYGIIPILMGLGCKVPAVLNIRVLEKKRERFISLILILLIAPCVGCSGMILNLAGQIREKSGGGLLASILAVISIFIIIFLIGIIAGYLLNKIKKGNSTEIFMEIPPLSFPRISELYLKMWIRMKELVLKTLPYIFIGVIFFNILCQLGAIEAISKSGAVKFVIADLLGLPIEDTFNIIFGFLRKDAAIGLLTIGTYKELIVASVFMSLYLPCTATIIMIKKEFSWKETLIALGITFFVAFVVSVLLNQILPLF